VMHAPATTVAVGSQVFCANRCSGGLAGYEDVNDAEGLCRDPVMRWVIVNLAIVGSGASPAKWAASRDEVAPAQKSFRADRSSRSVDRQSASAANAEADRFRHGFEREPDPWRAGRQRVQWRFRLHLLSTSVGVNRFGDA
jgi:hypothetical protein